MASLAPSIVPKKEQMLHEVQGHELITIFIGPKREKFSLHKDLLCAHSSYFAITLKIYTKNDLKKARINELHMPDEDPIIFGFLNDYLYRSLLPTQSADYFPELYSMAERLCMEDLMNKTVDSLKNLLATGTAFYSSVAVKNVYAITDEGSKFRDLVMFTLAAVFNDNRNPPMEWWKAYQDVMEAVPRIAVDLFRVQLEYRELLKRVDTVADAIAKLPNGAFHVRNPQVGMRQSARCQLLNYGLLF
ncbi:hypothetical protein BJ875DRAFT_437380 [Amylocarpus encephaloides]|uniref:BTB domain-containing protein n=1 Tax=Amylocarpus encephaloides TaxID=45428 RepID=A0A9P7YS24_9HELO|nr:hypothetical protein BJ875DRAFT_437380 [Amylocarpus encephaloides]